MSDVWQGPGWWLASDGKWYPAEAQPGGAGDGSAAAETSAETTTSTLIDDPVVEDVEATIDDTEGIGNVDAATVEIDDTPESLVGSVDEAVAAEPVDTALAGEPPVDDIEQPMPDPFAELPVEPAPEPATGTATESFAAPEVEPFVDADEPSARPGGGWQSVVPPEPQVAEPASWDPEPATPEAPHWTEPAAAPTEPTTAVDDDEGWTSAYEERQAAEASAPVDEPAEAPASTFEAPAAEFAPAPTSIDDVITTPPAFEPPAPDAPTEPDLLDDAIAPSAPPFEAPSPDAAPPPVATFEPPAADAPTEAGPLDDATTPSGPAFEASAADLPLEPVELLEPAEGADVAASAPSEPTPRIPVPRGFTTAQPETPDIPEVAPPPSVDAAGQRTAPPTPADEIHRDDAWRKPNGTTAVGVGAGVDDVDAGSRPGAPDVVDLAIPPESPLHPPIESGRRSPTLGILGAVVVLAVIVGLALLILWFFTRDGDDDEVVSDDAVATSSTAPPTTESSAPSTEPPPTTEAPPSDGEEVSVFELRAGDCIQDEIGSGQVQRLVRVDCSIPHEFEVYREALIDSTITEFDEEAISAQAEEVCRTSLADYVPPTDTRDLKFKWFQPTEDSWNQEDDPDRVITCLLFYEDGPLIGRAA